jgi:hypothetical protein
MKTLIRLETKIEKDLYDEFEVYAQKYGMVKSQLARLCFRLGLDVLKVALDQDYSKLLRAMNKKYEEMDFGGLIDKAK